MNALVVLCLVALGVNAKPMTGFVNEKGSISHAGIHRADGTIDRFPDDFAHNILLIGASGLVMKDGRNVQLTDALKMVDRSKRSAGFVNAKGSISHAGIHRADGTIDRFPHDFAHNILLIGASGLVMKDGRNVQLTDALKMVDRSKRSAGFVSEKGNIGHSGILRADGSTDLFSHDEAHNIVLIGPSGIVTKDGRNMQLTDALKIVGRNKRSAGFVSEKGNIGHSGILRADGSTDLFSHDEAHSIVLIGPSGIVTKDGRNMQLTDALEIVGRSKRSAGFVSEKGNIGHSGILRADGSTDLFSHDQAHNILLIGPSGIVTKDGRNMQLTEDLRIANPRTKRHTIGESGMILDDGTQVQFKKAGVKILLEGPSGILLSDGTAVQKRSKRHTIGESGMILDDGTQVQFKKAGVKILLEGPSGILLSDGSLVQKRA